MAKLSPHNHLSGSVLPAWLGFSPYQSPFDVLQTARDFNAGIEPAPLDSLPADIGTAVEPVIIERGLRMLGIDPALVFNYTDGNGKVICKEHSSLELYYSDDGLLDIHPDAPIVISQNDREGINVIAKTDTVKLSGKIVLEAKFTTVPEKPNDPPLFRGPIQLQAGMMCHGAEWGILFTCYAGRKIVAHIFSRHDVTRQMITKGVIDFETHMDAGTWPEPTTVEDMGRAFDTPAPEVLALPASCADPIDVWMAADEQIAQCDGYKIKAGLDLMGAMGNHEKGRLGNYEVKWPFRKTKPKPAVCCPKCSTELEPAKPASEARQKSISIKELK